MRELAPQLEYSDELLVVHDTEDEPVAEHDGHGQGVRLVAAGEPEGCSGKANDIAAGMEAARHDRLVWTDDDFHHPSDWLATINADVGSVPDAGLGECTSDEGEHRHRIVGEKFHAVDGPVCEAELVDPSAEPVEPVLVG